MQDHDGVPIPIPEWELPIPKPRFAPLSHAGSILAQRWGPQGSAHLSHGDVPNVREAVIHPVLILQERGHHSRQQCPCLEEEAEKHHQRRFW